MRWLATTNPRCGEDAGSRPSLPRSHPYNLIGRPTFQPQLLVGTSTVVSTQLEADELAAAHKRIAQLEAELALTRDACELFNDEAVMPPKRREGIPLDLPVG